MSMRKTGWAARLLALCLGLMICGSALPGLAEGTATDEALKMMDEAFEQMKTAAQEDEERNKEITTEWVVLYEGEFEENGEYMQIGMNVCTIRYNGHEMRCSVDVVGEPDENGLYPLYITLHGGGTAPAEVNDGEWYTMSQYYRMSVESGIYVAVRGMQDVWNLHFIEEAFPMYDRLIEDMVLLNNADPNRVYLMGFSAGGDGVYGVAPRMADRFAAVNMSSGHPNGISLINAANLPFEIQTGIRDFYTDDVLRSVRNAEFDDTLNGYAEAYGCPYIHRVLVHVPAGHNFVDYEGTGDGCVLKDPFEFAVRAEADYIPEQFVELFGKYTDDANIVDLSYAHDLPEFDQALKTLVTDTLGLAVEEDVDTNAVTWVNQYTRDSMPEKVVWDLSTRASTRKDTGFYWLRADYSVNSGVIEASYDRDSNTVTIHTDGAVNGEFSVVANPLMMDFDRPLRIVTDEGEYEETLQADMDVIRGSLEQTGDPYLAWAAEVPIR